MGLYVGASVCNTPAVGVLVGWVLLIVGLRVGLEDGVTVGHDDEAVGRCEGVDGEAVCDRDGRNDGMIDGLDDLLIEGLDDGGGDSTLLGSREGIVEGLVVGLLLRYMVGKADGCEVEKAWDGLRVGRLVLSGADGAIDGSLVGLFVRLML